MPSPRTALAVALLALVALPGLRAVGDDSFPLSTYPMFTAERDRVFTIATVEAFEADRTPVALSPAEIGGSIEVIQSAAAVNRAVRSGETAAFCSEVAGRVAADSGVTSVEVVTLTIDSRRWFDGDREPLGRRVHATCPTA